MTTSTYIKRTKVLGWILLPSLVIHSLLLSFSFSGETVLPCLDSSECVDLRAPLKALSLMDMEWGQKYPEGVDYQTTRNAYDLIQSSRNYHQALKVADHNLLKHIAITLHRAPRIHQKIRDSKENLFHFS